MSSSEKYGNMWSKVLQKGWIFWSRLNANVWCSTPNHNLHAVIRINMWKWSHHRTVPTKHFLLSLFTQWALHYWLRWMWYYFVMPSPLKFPHLNIEDMQPFGQIFLYKYLLKYRKLSNDFIGCRMGKTDMVEGFLWVAVSEPWVTIFFIL